MTSVNGNPSTCSREFILSNQPTFAVSLNTFHAMFKFFLVIPSYSWLAGFSPKPGLENESMSLVRTK